MLAQIEQEDPCLACPKDGAQNRIREKLVVEDAVDGHRRSSVSCKLSAESSEMVKMIDSSFICHSERLSTNTPQGIVALDVTTCGKFRPPETKESDSLEK